MSPKAYVGITGYETAAQVAAVRNSVPADRLLMVGCGMRGHPIRWNPDKWPNRCPPPAKMRTIFGCSPNVLNIVHLTPLEGCDLDEHMCMAHDIVGPTLHGFQLNMPWPDINALVRYKSRFDHAVITLPLQPEALDVVGSDPVRIARKLKQYDGIADYTLIDSSAGDGKEFDVRFTHDCFDAISTLMPNIGLVAVVYVLTTLNRNSATSSRSSLSVRRKTPHAGRSPRCGRSDSLHRENRCASAKVRGAA